MIGVCLVVAGAVQATLPVDAFTISWHHSVEKTRWEERYRVDGRNLLLVEARVEASGAGMEPSQDAVNRDGMWVWNPKRSLEELRLTVSSFAADYELCAGSQCQSLRDWTGARGDGVVVTVRGCRVDSAQPPQQR